MGEVMGNRMSRWFCHLIVPVVKDYARPIRKAVAQFLTMQLGYHTPARSVKNSGLRTSYVQVTLPA